MSLHYLSKCGAVRDVMHMESSASKGEKVKCKPKCLFKAGLPWKNLGGCQVECVAQGLEIDFLQKQVVS